MSDDNWSDDGGAPAPIYGGARTNGYNSNDRGRGRGRGRGGGGSSRDDDGDRGGWRNRNDDDGDRGGWRNRNDDGGGGFRGRGRGGGRGDGDERGGGGGFRGRGRGGGGGFRRGGGSDDEDPRGGGGGWGRGRGRGRGDSDGGGGGGGWGRRDDEGGEKGEEEKPRERYIPPEPTDDENVLFGSGTSAGINFDKYENIQVKVSGENPVAPIESFDSCGLREFVYNNVIKSGYKKPTPVQKHAMPIIMAGRDLMACAQTGSGKTAAFLVPMINTLLDKPKAVTSGEMSEPQVIIMSPTRELAIQIQQEARKFAHGSILKICIAYGGAHVFSQADKLKLGCHILVATPGRLNDFVNRGRVSFASVRFFVLDEADRMLDMGFHEDVKKMLGHPTMPPVGERQTLMFSATFPPQIQQLASEFCNNYLFLAVGIVGGACADVEQTFFEVSKFDKKEKLSQILMEQSSNGKPPLTLVFVEQKRTADFVAAYLSENSIPTTSIHGDRLQSQREMALSDFRSGRKSTLIATGVASRGLDIKNVAHVINFDLPREIDEYVHRIGRTGRVGNRGKATSFFDPDENGTIAGDLVQILEQCNQVVPPFLGSAGGGGGFSSRGDSFGGRDVRKGGSGGGGFSAPSASAVQEEEEDW